MTTFREEARRKGAIAAERARTCEEQTRQQESTVSRIAERVGSEKDWLEDRQLRVFLDNDWNPNFGVRVCRRFDGSAPTSAFDNEMECCSIWTGGDGIRYSLIEFNHVDIVYLEDEALGDNKSDEEVWTYFVKKVCDRFDLIERLVPSSQRNSEG
jgi:hypothetical protein